MKTKLILCAVVAATAFTPLFSGRAESPAPGKASTAATAASGEKSESSNTKANRNVPFRGKVASIDRQQMTFTLSGPKQRTFHLNSDTKIEKDGKPAAVGDIATGDEARGLYQSEGDGELVVIKASFGPKPEKTAATEKTTAKAGANESGS